MKNALGQEVGPLVTFRPRPPPPSEPLVGRFVTLEPLDPSAHADDLHDAYADDVHGRGWTWMGYGPFPTRTAFRAWLDTLPGTDPLFFAACVDGRAAGLASWLNVCPEAGRLEVGHIHFAPRLQRTRAATEAMDLMRRRVFDLGYRRYEWKCDALNARSRRAAERLGFSFEGVFRQHLVVKGRNRDTAWFACVDHEEPALRAAFAAWLDDANFEGGHQLRALGTFTGPVLSARDPTLRTPQP